ncbi:MAG TPA: replication-associated recombination protein A [Chitinophagaceae bacterium]|nr:replication-associated recombination protein A [Chitinophagaceae bacterium]
MLFGTKKPLAERIRPKTLAEYIGQETVIGRDSSLRKILNSGQLHSMILWGPPGVGKTTLAKIIATEAHLPFYELSAIESGVKEIRTVIDQAKQIGTVLLFIDEIHRFNKAQQDRLLSAVEKGEIILVGATTENPSFEIISALLSRCQVYVLDAFSEEQLKALVYRAIEKDTWLQSFEIKIIEWESLIRFSGGDGRRILNLFELVVQSLIEKEEMGEKILIDNNKVQQIIQANPARYDKTGEQHYDIISAFIKSIRGSDPNAAVYYLARMIEGGEDPKFIARRLVIAASEDIGLANPNALLLATNCFEAVQMIGYPECRIILSQCTIYLATSPKSNASYMAINKAQALVRQTGDLSIPLSLRNAPTKLMKNMNYGKDYQYAHDKENSFAAMEFLPGEISNTVLYEPGNNPSEEKHRQHLRYLWKEKYNY